MIVVPCKDCVERHESCHSSCDKYVDWRRMLDEQKRKIYSVKTAEREVRNHKNAVISKACKKSS